VPALRDLTGQRFGMLVVTGRAENRAQKVLWACYCDCGRQHDVDAQALLRGSTRSCGCLWKTVQRATPGTACARIGRGGDPRTGTRAGFMAHYYADEDACPACVEGHRAAQAARREAEPLAVLSANLRYKYRLSLERYEALLSEQGGCCAICRVDAPTDVRTSRFHVDHDHACCPGSRSCGRCVRGLLCHACNTALGNFRDDPERLQSALRYLTRRTAREPLPAEAERLS
jgi:hypothetical protein